MEYYELPTEGHCTGDAVWVVPMEVWNNYKLWLDKIDGRKDSYGVCTQNETVTVTLETCVFVFMKVVGNS